MLAVSIRLYDFLFACIGPKLLRPPRINTLGPTLQTYVKYLNKLQYPIKKIILKYFTDLFCIVNYYA